MDITAKQVEWLQAIAAASHAAAAAELEQRFFGPRGEVLEMVRSVTSLPKEERPAFGKAANAVKQAVESALNERLAGFEQAEMDRELSATDFDPTEPGPKPRSGALHP